MGRLILLLLVLIVLGGPIALGFTRPALVPASALDPHKPDLENGRTMFLASGCASCHATPDQEDTTRLGGGRELASQFGTFRVPNISPHVKDGIGGWTEANFVNAMLRGASPKTEHYYPAFPYTSYAKMSAADVRDLFAYIQSLPPVEGITAGHDLPFPFNLRAGIGLWKMLHFDQQPFRRDVAKSDEWNRGAYLVEGAGHCAECHSPRDWMGGIVPGQRMAGGPNPAGGGSVPNITQHPSGLADWSEEEIAAFLETGETPDGDEVSGDMALVVKNLARLSVEDRRAMAHYLKSREPVAGPRRN